MIAIVTGASRGIGRAIAERLARDWQAKLFLVYRARHADAEETASACRALGSEVRLHPTDLADPAAADAAIAGLSAAVSPPIQPSLIQPSLIRSIQPQPYSG